jgi:hypothetical protein
MFEERFSVFQTGLDIHYLHLNTDKKFKKKSILDIFFDSFINE